MGFFERKRTYYNQTNSKSLTAKQRRRTQKKINACYKGRPCPITVVN